MVEVEVEEQEETAETDEIIREELQRQSEDQASKQLDPQDQPGPTRRKWEKRTHWRPNRSAGPFACSCGEKSTCPEVDISGLVGRQNVNLDSTSMLESENHIFGSASDDVRQAVKRANEILQRRLVELSLSGANKKVASLFDTAIESQAVKIADNWYLPGGHWKPARCTPRWKVAIIIPFRDRFAHLPIILKYLVPMLNRQRLEFGVFTINQANQELFNRAMLMNVGFLEALNFTDYDCFIFHDVDHIPLDDRNYYGCSRMPRHFLSGSDRWNYRLPYDNFFGAVTGLSKGQIRLINGFPNVYWGWGGEDDEILKRVKDVGLEVSRVKGTVGHYDVITHHHESAPQVQDRYGLMKTFNIRYKGDGLSDIAYPTPSYTLNALYTNVSVDIRKIKPHYPMPAPPEARQAAQKALLDKFADLKKRQARK
ncbi:beta-1,4-galactosyltransferase 5-like [Diadema antillarum]|uniref:beta-1,4-galactosyltransferase 5-like n=1 Tax=Diadema antillarum TaxID=105358 RepID=UPI003A83A7A1